MSTSLFVLLCSLYTCIHVTLATSSYNAWFSACTHAERSLSALYSKPVLRGEGNGRGKDRRTMDRSLVLNIKEVVKNLESHVKCAVGETKKE